MWLLINLLIDAGILFLLAQVIPGVRMRSYGTAIIVALVIGILNATIGFLIRLPLNIITLGLLSFLVRLFVTGIIIMIADRLLSGFEVRSFSTALLLSIAMAALGTLVHFII